MQLRLIYRISFLFFMVPFFNSPFALANELENLPPALQESDFYPVNEQQAKLGQLLFYDKILSGNRNISCATCHSTEFGTSDGLSLGIGEGGIGVGVERSFGEGSLRAERRVPRNSPGLWNLGAKEFTVLFHDGRISLSDLWESGFDSPAEEFLPLGLTDLAAVQALFPLTSGLEMAGNKNENSVPGAVHRRIDYAWKLLTDRVRNISSYEQMFVESFDDIQSKQDINIVHIANAISAFERFEFRADQSAFDRYLRGEVKSLTATQVSGMELFYGKADCVQCHSGPLQTDHKFHNLALPFIGPGRTRKFEFKARDMGRINETDDAQDAYKFITPSLRNVELTAPYGHNGAYKNLGDIVKHHLDPVNGFMNYNLTNSVLIQADHINSDTLLWQDKQERQRILSTVTPYTASLTRAEQSEIIEFLKSLTDKGESKLKLGVPTSVPSGLLLD